MGGGNGSVRYELYGRQMRRWVEGRERCRDELYGRQMRGWVERRVVLGTSCMEGR